MGRSSQYKLRLGRRRTGHASQTIVVYPPTGSTAYVRETSTPPTLLLEYGPPLSLRFRTPLAFLELDFLKG